MDERVRGFWAAILCYGLWGLVPLYWRLVQHIPAIELISHRIIWSSVFCLIFVFFLKQGRAIWEALKKSFWTLVLTTLLVSSNWLVFVWAINEERIMETSLGYYINPILNIFLGAVLLKEKLTRLQKASTVLASLAVAHLLISSGGFPWVSLTLAVTFALYGLLRKVAPIEPLAGLTLESTLIAPLALAYAGTLGVTKTGHFGLSFFETGMLVGAGIITLVPLLLFLYSIRRIHLSTMGFLQFITPTGTFLLAIFYYKESFSTDNLITFGLIWLSIALYLSDLRLKRT